MERVDARRALELLIDIVEARGEDFTYEQVPNINRPTGQACQYQHEGSPSCLVGQVLYRAGAPMQVLEEMDIFGITANKVNERFPNVSQYAAQVLNAAQIVQDQGKPWGEALSNAKRKYEMVKGFEA